MNVAANLKRFYELESESVKIPDSYKEEVLTLAEQGKDMEYIAFKLMHTRKERLALIERMMTPGDIYHLFFSEGFTTACLTIDDALFTKATSGDIEAAKLMEERRVAREQRDLRKELFGI